MKLIMSSITGCKLADLEILTVAPHKTFVSLILTSKSLNQLDTGQCKNQLYEARVRYHLPKFTCLVGIFPRDEKNKWKEVYDALINWRDDPLVFYYSCDDEAIIPTTDTILDSGELLKSRLNDDNFYLILALNQLSKTDNYGLLIETIVNNAELKSFIYINGAFRLLKWIDSIGLLEEAMDRVLNGPEDMEYPVRLIIRSGNLDMLKWIFLEKHYDLMDNEFATFDEGGDTETANIAVRYGHVHMLDWLKEQGFTPDFHGIYYALQELDNLAFDPVKSKGEIDRQSQVMQEKMQDTLEWMTRAGLDIKFAQQHISQYWSRKSSIRFWPGET